MCSSDLIEPVAVGLLRPHMVGVGEPPDLCLAESVDAHEFAAGVPVLIQCPAQSLTFLTDGLVDSLLRIARSAESVDGRNLIPHPKCIKTTVTIVELRANLRHSIMCVVGEPTGARSLAARLDTLRVLAPSFAFPLLPFPLQSFRLSFEKIDCESVSPSAASIMLRISFRETTVTRSESLTGCSFPRLTIV